MLLITLGAVQRLLKDAQQSHMSGTRRAIIAVILKKKKKKLKKLIQTLEIILEDSQAYYSILKVSSHITILGKKNISFDIEQLD